ncbi:MAG: hypothetical protein Q9217_006597 [Psora testacea]
MSVPLREQRDTVREYGAEAPTFINLITVGPTEYYVHQTASHHLPFSPSSFETSASGSPTNDLVPCTVINWTQDQFTENDLKTIVAKYARLDDVWTPAFLPIVILRVSKAVSVNFVSDVASILTEISATELPNGPYTARPATGEVFALSRLFDDRYEAFIGGSVRPSLQNHSFEWLEIELRFAVKDIIDVAGLETGCGNRDYRRHYAKRVSTAPSIQQLIDAGAVFVGKTKTTQFAEGQTPIEWFDYLAPFNPRGDSYQTPSSSSAGSAVASAAYQWLDFTIATDTGGSIRHPAGVCGVYGFRPSTGAILTAGIYSVSPVLDTVGPLARSVSIVGAAVKCMADPTHSLLRPTRPHVRYKLLYPIRAKGTKPEDSGRWFPFPGEPSKAARAESQFEEFICQLESCIECTRHSFNIDDLWRETRPNGQSESLDEATGHIYTVLSTYDCVRQTIDPFIDDFKAANKGRSPFIDPVVKTRIVYGRHTSTAQYTAAVQAAEMFSKWITKSLFAQSEESELPLLVFPQSWGHPDYRVDPDKRPLFFSTFSSYSLSYLSGCPDCTIPIGEVQSHSGITEAEMSLPISLSLLGPPGEDSALLQLLIDLEKKGVLNPPAAGTLMYPAER